jgi:hypothetical protein
MVKKEFQFRFSIFRRVKRVKSQKNIVVMSKNYFASSIRTAEDASNIFPYAIEDEKVEEYDENEEEEVSHISSH